MLAALGKQTGAHEGRFNVRADGVISRMASRHPRNVSSKIDAMSARVFQCLGRMQFAQPIPNLLVDPPTIHRGTFPAHPTDEANHLHSWRLVPLLSSCRERRRSIRAVHIVREVRQDTGSE
jgi:hypothetical protein